MGKSFKRVLSSLLVAVMMISYVPLAGIAGLELPSFGELFSTKASAESYSGTCGDNLTWNLDTETGVLTINGTGEMTDYYYHSTVPWRNYTSYIKKVLLPDGITNIGGEAFAYCESLTEITIPASVTSIGFDAFYGCNNLKTVNNYSELGIVDGSRSDGYVGYYADTVNWYFSDSGKCGDNLTYTFDGKTFTLTISGTGDMDDYGFYNSTPWSEHKTCIKTVIIENGVTNISDTAFLDCSKLTSITISNSVTSIGNSVFYFCTSLTEITIPNSVISIGNGAFAYCDSLTRITVDKGNQYYSSDEYGVLFDKNKHELIKYPTGNTRTEYTIPDSVTSIGYSAFEDCTGLTSITIPDGVTRINGYTFSGCSNLTSITIPNSVTSIGDSTFCYCNSLTSIIIGGGVTTISDEAFAYCDSLTRIIVDKGNQYYSSDEYGVLFDKDKHELIQYPIGNTRVEYTIPNSVTVIGDNAFSSCYSLASVIIGGGVTSIGNSAFACCDSLTSITIPDSVTSIGIWAFNNCSSLTSVTIPDGVTHIGFSAFEDCSNLVSITIPDSVTSIGSGAFYGTAYYNDENNWDEDKILYIGNHLIRADISISGDYTIKSGTITIGGNAFSACSDLANITIPDSVVSIGYDAFSGCVNLANITIPDSVVDIGGYAFYNCENLTSITIPDSVTTIGEYAFYDCTNLTNMVIGSGVRNIGNGAFLRTGIDEVFIPAGVTYIDDYAFSTCYDLKSITVDENNQYYSSDSFGVLFNKDKTVLIQYPIGNERTSYTIPNTVVTIKNRHVNEGDVYKHSFGSFDYAKNLIDIGLPISVINVDNSSFSNCLNLANIYYGGNESDKGKILIDTGNEELLSATWHYNSYPGTEISYTINFYDGETLLGSKTLKLDEDGTLSYGKIPTKDGYKFVGWSNIKGGPALFNDGMAIKNLATENGAQVNYYAVWSKNQTDSSEADADTGVIVYIPAGTYEDKVTLEVEEILSGSSFSIVNSISGAIASKVFSIETYVNGVKTQPDGYVTVKIPVPAGYNTANCKIYYVNTEKGVAEEVPFTVENGYFVFSTNHFSDWAIVEIGEKTLVSIAIKTPPTTYEYKYGIANLDTSGLEIVATYSDGSTAILDNSEVEFTGFDTSERGIKTVTATYEGCTATFDIEVYFTFWQWLLYIICFGWIWM